MLEATSEVDTPGAEDEADSPGAVRELLMDVVGDVSDEEDDDDIEAVDDDSVTDEEESDGLAAPPVILYSVSPDTILHTRHSVKHQLTVHQSRRRNQYRDTHNSDTALHSCYSHLSLSEYGPHPLDRSLHIMQPGIALRLMHTRRNIEDHQNLT